MNKSSKSMAKGLSHTYRMVWSNTEPLWYWLSTSEKSQANDYKEVLLRGNLGFFCFLLFFSIFFYFVFSFNLSLIFFLRYCNGSLDEVECSDGHVYFILKKKCNSSSFGSNKYELRPCSIVLSHINIPLNKKRTKENRGVEK